MFRLTTVYAGQTAFSLYGSQDEADDWAANWRLNWPEGTAAVTPQRTSPMDNATLYNCCTGNAAPDWTQYASLFIGGCIDHDGHTEGGVPVGRAQFFTVYGRTHEGYADAITDTRVGASLAHAVEIGSYLTHVSSLTCTLCPTLDPANHEPGGRALFAPGDLSSGAATDAARAAAQPCPAAACVNPDHEAAPEVAVIGAVFVAILFAALFVFGGGVVITGTLAALFTH